MGFKFVFYRIGDMDVTNNVTNDDVLTPIEKVVYQLICKNPYITRTEIAAQISKTPRTVQRTFDSLKDKPEIKEKAKEPVKESILEQLRKSRVQADANNEARKREQALQPHNKEAKQRF